MAAASRACRFSYGYAAGFGPVQYVAPNATIVCVGADAATPQQQSFQALQGYQSSCSATTTTSVQCNAATDDFCHAAGYATGLPIEEFSGTNAAFSCVSAPEAQVVSESWSALSGYYPGCSYSSVGQPGVCMPAADDDCQGRGDKTGFGVQQYNGTQAQISWPAVKRPGQRLVRGARRAPRLGLHAPQDALEASANGPRAAAKQRERGPFGEFDHAELADFVKHCKATWLGAGSRIIRSPRCSPSSR